MSGRGLALAGLALLVSHREWQPALSPTPCRRLEGGRLMARRASLHSSSWRWRCSSSPTRARRRLRRSRIPLLSRAVRLLCLAPANVTVSWASPRQASPRAGVAGRSERHGRHSVSCTWSNAEGSRSTSTNVRRDASPPRVTASADRGPDNNDWYNHGLTITFSGSDDVSGIASCTTASYSGPDTGHTAVPGSCSDNAGNSSGTGFELKYDATPPTVALPLK
jgi:hypothetical protein